MVVSDTGCDTPQNLIGGLFFQPIQKLDVASSLEGANGLSLAIPINLCSRFNDFFL
jgi:hypothetical protein